MSSSEAWWTCTRPGSGGFVAQGAGLAGEHRDVVLGVGGPARFYVPAHAIALTGTVLRMGWLNPCPLGVVNPCPWALFLRLVAIAVLDAGTPDGATLSSDLHFSDGTALPRVGVSEATEPDLTLRSDKESVTIAANFACRQNWNSRCDCLRLSPPHRWRTS